MTYCSNCGSPLHDDDKFCHSCGAKVEQLQMVPPQAETPQMASQQMGMPQATIPLMGASNGVSHQGTSNSAPPQGTPYVQTPPPPPPPSGGAYHASGATPSPMPYQAPRRKNSPGKIVGKVLLALLPLGISVGGYSLWHHLGKKAAERALESTTRQLSRPSPSPTTSDKKDTEMKVEPKATQKESTEQKPRQQEPAEAMPKKSVKSEVRQPTPSIPQQREQGMPMGYTDEEIRAMQGRQSGKQQGMPMGYTDEEIRAMQGRQSGTRTTQTQSRRRSAEQIISSFGPNTDASARARLRQMKAQGTITTEEYNDCMRYIERRRHAGQ